MILWKEEGIEDRRAGDDLLSRALRQSTMGAKGFHIRVRDGIVWDTFAIITGSSIFYKKAEERINDANYLYVKYQANQTISIA